MTIATSNRLLPILAGVVLLMLAYVSVKSCTPADDEVVLDRVPQAPSPDADTPADTIKTLTANVAAMTAEVQALRQDNTDLRKDNRALIASRDQIEQRVATRLKRELVSREHDQTNRARIDSGVVSSLTARMDALTESIAKIRTTTPASEIPVGLGLDGQGWGQDELLWIEPVDRRASDDPETGRFDRTETLARRYLPGGTGDTDGATRRPEAEDRPAPVQPFYTVPRNATLIGATAMTALVGRIPVDGQVRDPLRFKILTGHDNLAANGQTVPGVEGMVWSGTAVGDWTLSCVRGRLDSVTFVFDDGTIQTVSADDGQGAIGGANNGLGWISDVQGIPCISGARKTNAPAFLTQRIGVTAIQAAAAAAAAAQTTSIVGETGRVTNSVTGDTGNYVLGKTLEGGSDEVARWLLERQAQSFDAVFVAAGTPVAIHVERELPIDLHPNGRKLAHANATPKNPQTRLD